MSNKTDYIDFINNISEKVDSEKLSMLIDFFGRQKAIEEKKSFLHAMNEFKKAAPKITKDGVVDFVTKNGQRKTYNHTTLAHIEEKIQGLLAENFLSYCWNVDQLESQIKVTCILSHVDGHSEKVSMKANSDLSGNKNAIQAIGSTISYLERYTLLAALGLSTGEDDDNGDSYQAPSQNNQSNNSNFISPKQFEELNQLLDSCGADKVKFCNVLNVQSLNQLNVADYMKAKNMIELKIKAQNNANT